MKHVALIVAVAALLATDANVSTIENMMKAFYDHDVDAFARLNGKFREPPVPNAEACAEMIRMRRKPHYVAVTLNDGSTLAGTAQLINESVDNIQTRIDKPWGDDVDETHYITAGTVNREIMLKTGKDHIYRLRQVTTVQMHAKAVNGVLIGYVSVEMPLTPLEIVRGLDL